jgi:hypothetical protein
MSGLLVLFAVRYQWDAATVVGVVVAVWALCVTLLSVVSVMPFPLRYFVASIALGTVLCIVVSAAFVNSVLVGAQQSGLTDAGPVILDERSSSDSDTEHQACVDPTAAFTAPWGPDRPLIDRATGSVPAFNNAMNHYRSFPSQDGRQQVIEVNNAEFTGYGGYFVEQTVYEGETYRLRMFPVNTGAQGQSQTTAKNVLARLVSPQCASTEFRVVGTVTAANAVPEQVWSSVLFKADRPFRMVLSERPSKACFAEVTYCDNTVGFNPIPDVGRLFSPPGLPIGSRGFGGEFGGDTDVEMMIYLTPRFE